MFAALLQHHCQFQQFFFTCRCSVRRDDVRDFRLTFGYRSCFIENYGTDLARFFQRDRCLEQYTVPGAHTAANHYSNRSSKSKSTWAADHQNRYCSCQSKAGCPARQQPYYQRDRCYSYYCRHEYSGDSVGDLCDRRLRRRSITYHFYDLRKACIFTYMYSAALHITGLIDRSG